MKPSQAFWITLPETKKLPLKIGLNAPKGKDHLPTTIFQVLCYVSLPEGKSFSPNICMKQPDRFVVVKCLESFYEKAQTSWKLDNGKTCWYFVEAHGKVSWLALSRK